MKDIKNEDIIDLACGTGYYTRIFREKTDGKVYGVDISEDMLNFAKSKLTKLDEITYILHDCSIPLKVAMQFDIVSATFLYQYAKNYDMLLAFLKNTHSLLKPGGKLIGLNAKLDIDLS